MTVFTRDGFRSAQVADIAGEARLSVGTLYLYADSKQALFELAIREALGDNVAQDVTALPLHAAGLETTAARLEEASTARAVWPKLNAALCATRPQPTADAEIAAIVGELFDLLWRERPIIWLLDRCAREVPKFWEIYGGRVRARYFDDLAHYIRSRRPPAHSGPGETAVARAMVEMVAWMAMHRLRTPNEMPMDAALARQACITLASGGLLAGSEPAHS